VTEGHFQADDNDQLQAFDGKDWQPYRDLLAENKELRDALLAAVRCEWWEWEGCAECAPMIPGPHWQNYHAKDAHCPCPCHADDGWYRPAVEALDLDDDALNRLMRDVLASSDN